LTNVRALAQKGGVYDFSDKQDCLVKYPQQRHSFVTFFLLEKKSKERKEL
jgi:hypothetical protein